MRIGAFTPLLSSLSLEDVFNKLVRLDIRTVELGTGNYPGDPHCKLVMLDDAVALKTFKTKLADNGFSISALSCSAIPEYPQFADGLRQLNILEAEFASHARHGWVDV